MSISEHTDKLIVPLAVVLLVLKLAEVVPIDSWSWWWVTAPLWGGFILNTAIRYTIKLSSRHTP